ncbi:MAG: WYL domain-containing protein [Actinomycetota bacterium]
MNARLNARDRLARLLSVIPWVADQPDGALIDDIVDRFAYPRTQLLEDLEDVLFFVGVHPFTPDSLIEVNVSDDRVEINYAEWFARPLRLSSEEGARLLTAGRSVLAMAVADEDDAASPLLRALTKLGTALGEGAERAVDVRLGAVPGDTLGVLRSALDRGVQIDLEYYSYGRDELAARRVEPARVFSDQGNWYLSGWCHRADGERVFRVDRIRSAVATDLPVERSRPASEGSFTPSSDDPRVTLRLSPTARWVVEQYPIESVDDQGDALVVTMAVSARAWLERLLLRLGPDATVLEADPALGSDLASSAADRILARYA